MHAAKDRQLDWLGAVGPVLWRVFRRSRVEPIVPAWSGFYREETVRGVLPKVDVYLPQTPGPRPSVVLIHGGGFILGSRRMSSMTYLASELITRGFAVASIDYRLLFRGGRLDEALDDVGQALAWWQSQSDTYQLDAGRVALLGCSAGAALMMLTSLQAQQIWKMVGIYGVYDFEDLPGRPSVLPARILLNTRDEEHWAKRSPYQQLGAKVPTLLLHGCADNLVKKRHTDKMAQCRRDAGYPVSTRYYLNEPHGFLQDGPARPAVAVALRDILEFLDE